MAETRFLKLSLLCYNIRNLLIFVVKAIVDMETVISQHIEVTPGICGGKPRIAGHRIKVQDIVIWHERMGMSPDEIIYHHPSITLADVYAALAYYHDHREEIRRQIEGGESFAKQLQGNQPSLIQKILKYENVKQD
jgi:uncharacterized protein (DUF433 family)